MTENPVQRLWSAWLRLYRADEALRRKYEIGFGSEPRSLPAGRGETAALTPTEEQ